MTVTRVITTEDGVVLGVFHMKEKYPGKMESVVPTYAVILEFKDDLRQAYSL